MPIDPDSLWRCPMCDSLQLQAFEDGDPEWCTKCTYSEDGSE